MQVGAVGAPGHQHRTRRQRGRHRRRPVAQRDPADQNQLGEVGEGTMVRIVPVPVVQVRGAAHPLGQHVAEGGQQTPDPTHDRHVDVGGVAGQRRQPVDRERRGPVPGPGIVERHPAAGRVDQVHRAAGAGRVVGQHGGHVGAAQRGPDHVTRRIRADGVDHRHPQPQRVRGEQHPGAGVADPQVDGLDGDGIHHRQGEAGHAYPHVDSEAADHQKVVHGARR